MLRSRFVLDTMRMVRGWLRGWTGRLTSQAGRNSSISFVFFFLFFFMLSGSPLGAMPHTGRVGNNRYAGLGDLPGYCLTR